MIRAIVTYTGRNNLQRVGRTLTQARNNYRVIGTQIVDTNAEIFYNTLMEVISEQNFKPLNPEYKARKSLLGLSTNILMATTEYVSSIKIRRINSGSALSSRHVGVDANAVHSPSGMPMSELAIIHEYGTSDGRIPPRPHYTTAWGRCKDKVRQNTLAYARSIMTGRR